MAGNIISSGFMSRATLDKCRLFYKGVMSNAEFTNKFSFATYCEPEICENLHVAEHNRFNS